MLYFKTAIFAGYLVCVMAFIYAMAVSFVAMATAGAVSIAFSYCVGRVLGFLHTLVQSTSGAPEVVKRLI